MWIVFRFTTSRPHSLDRNVQSIKLRTLLTTQKYAPDEFSLCNDLCFAQLCNLQQMEGEGVDTSTETNWIQPIFTHCICTQPIFTQPEIGQALYSLSTLT